MTTGDDPVRLAVLGSGNGSNFQALADAMADGRLKARAVCVLSNVPDAFILERARRLGIPAEYIDPSPFKTKLDGPAEARVLDRLRHYGAELVALAGFMMIVKARLLAAYPGRIVNIHPSLLPRYPGLHAWRQALDDGATESGCTVHIVDAGTDTGPILLQRMVPVLAGDTAETLHARIQAQEHEAYPEALRRVIDALPRSRPDGAGRS